MRTHLRISAVTLDPATGQIQTHCLITYGEFATPDDAVHAANRLGRGAWRLLIDVESTGDEEQQSVNTYSQAPSKE